MAISNPAVSTTLPTSVYQSAGSSPMAPQMQANATPTDGASSSDSGGGLTAALPYLGAGAAGLLGAGLAASQSSGAVNTLNSLGSPYTQAGNSLLSQAMSGTLTPANQGVVSTLNAQGQQLIDSAAPLAGIANTAFTNYSAGQLQPGQQQQIDAWTASAKQSLAQSLASSGVSDSSVLASQNAAIDAQATQLKANLMAQNLQVGDQQYSQWLTATQAGQQLQAQGAQWAANSLNTMLTQALQLGQVGINQQSSAVQTGLQQNAQLSNSVGNLLKSLGTAYAVANKPAGAATSTGGGGSSPGVASLSSSQDPNSNTISSQYDVPSLSDVNSGNYNPNFDTNGYAINPDATVDTNTFQNSFFDPTTDDVPDIDFGP